MSQTLTVSQSGLADSAQTVHTCTTGYSEALKELKASMATISSKWSGDESGAVALFEQAVKRVEGALDEAESLMQELDSTLTRKSGDFNDAATKAQNAFKGLM